MKFKIILIITMLFSSFSYGGELEDRNKISENVINALQRNSFAELENMSKIYRDTEERTSSGLWKLTFFYGGFESIYSNGQKSESERLKLIKKIDLWISIYPKSPTPYIAKAVALKKEAWSIRGSGFSNTVAPEAWKPFYDKIESSKGVLEKSKSISSKDPHWYSVMADIAKIQSWDEAKYKDLTNQGISKFPNYYQLYFSAMDYYTPKWRGDATKIEQFASEMLEITKTKEGFGMYARIYWYASQSQFQGQLFQKSKVRWDTMSRGIDDVLSKYPDQWNINNFALFSCLAQDREKTKKLISLIELPLIKSAWLGNLKNYEKCKMWTML